MVSEAFKRTAEARFLKNCEKYMEFARGEIAASVRALREQNNPHAALIELSSALNSLAYAVYYATPIEWPGDDHD
jgi:hypothetical protein